MTTPHASWAAEYDRIFEGTFGPLYDALTRMTVETILATAPPPADVVDFGAGTGRLVAPLVAAGYRVTAVDPCARMLEVLRAKPGLSTVPVRLQRAEDFSEPACCDLALCVFTVTAYWTSRRSLERSLAAIARSIRPGGRLLIDLPSRLVFQGTDVRTRGMRRSVSIRPLSNDRYRYEERTVLKEGDGERTVSDRFTIRWWDPAQVLGMAERAGLVIESELGGRYSGTGADYFLLLKANPARVSRSQPRPRAPLV